MMKFKQTMIWFSLLQAVAAHAIDFGYSEGLSTDKLAVDVGTSESLSIDKVGDAAITVTNEVTQVDSVAQGEGQPAPRVPRVEFPTVRVKEQCRDRNTCGEISEMMLKACLSTAGIYCDRYVFHNTLNEGQSIKQLCPSVSASAAEIQRIVSSCWQNSAWPFFAACLKD